MQLTEEGIEVGPIDGIMGSKTRSGIQELENTHPELNELPPISVSNASVYCRTIGLLRNSTVGWSSVNGFINLTTGREMPTSHVQRAKALIENVTTFYRDDLNVLIPQTIEVVISDSADEAAALAAAKLAIQGEHSDITDGFIEWCRGYGYCGKSYGGVLAISYAAASGFPRNDMHELIAHEIAHEIQAQYVGNFRARGEEHRVSHRGPNWLTEALAHALAKHIRNPHKHPKYDLKKANLRREYESERLKDFIYQSSAWEDDFQDYSVFAGLSLVAKASHHAVIKFWEKTPELGWEDAFQLAFGLTVDGFYQKFGNL
ncbi:hypothetical protein ROA7450_03396 [Roseovarius albus]|uniref:Uncharacterized protein n=2 Tax=Roseovarius albus TaxID=1247867 RepID=A0A1X6ZXH7_9RHOB|nr:hypothetical protein ROA7450_03396 [Roseovarius albus]